MKQFKEISKDNINEIELNKTVVKLNEVEEVYLLIIELVKDEIWVGRSIINEKETKSISLIDIKSFSNEYTDFTLPKHEFDLIQEQVLTLDLDQQLKRLEDLAGQDIKAESKEEGKHKNKLKDWNDKQKSQQSNNVNNEDFTIQQADKELLIALITEGFNSLINKIKNA